MTESQHRWNFSRPPAKEIEEMQEQRRSRGFREKLVALRDERGATAIEYGLLAALIAAVIIITVSLLGTNLTSLFDTLAEAIGDAL